MRASSVSTAFLAIAFTLVCAACGDGTATDDPTSPADAARTPSPAASVTLEETPLPSPSPTEPVEAEGKGPAPEDMLACQTAAKIAEALSQNDFPEVEEEAEKLRAQLRKVQDQRLDAAITSFLKAFDRGDAEKTPKAFADLFKACGSLG